MTSLSVASLSVTRSLTLTVPGLRYVCVGVAPVVSKLPSPSRSHSYVAMVPSGSAEVVPSKATASPISGFSGL